MAPTGTAASTGTTAPTGSMAPTGSAGTDATGTPTGAAGAGNNMVPPDMPPDGPVTTCTPGIPTTSQVPRLWNREYDNVVEQLLGVETLESGQKPSERLNADVAGNIDPLIWNAYQDVANVISTEVIAGPNKASFIACDPAAVATCYEDTIRSFGRKAFRRPLTDVEVARFMTLTTIPSNPPGTADEISQTLLYAFLVSPSFIMVPEIGDYTDPAVGAVAEGSGFQRTSYEVATRLALTLWGGLPDEELDVAADDDELTTAAAIKAQADRMLQARDKVAGQMALAHRRFVLMNDASHWWKTSHSPVEFPGYTEEAKDSMLAELDAFFTEVAFTGTSFKDVFTSTKGFVNAETATLYGLPAGDYGAELAPVDLPDRPGFLTRVGFLSSFSDEAQTSPIRRGAFISVNLIGVNLPVPEPVSRDTPIPPGDYATRRAEIEALTRDDACATCHATFLNPPGFVLEGFNAVGVAQTQDPLGGPIDTTATVTFSSEAKLITTPLELMTELGNDAATRRLYAERIVSFLTGRFPNENDACLVNDLDAKLAADGYTAVNLFADLTQADSFRVRTVGN